MSKAKALFGLAVLVSLFAVSVTPASAWFESAGKNTTGKGSAGKTTFTDEGATVSCEKAEGEWKIESLTKQELTKAGPHLIVNVKKWNECTAFGFIGAEVKPCEFELKQEKGSTMALSSVVSECLVKANGNCELKAPKTKANENLKEIKLANSGSNLISTVNVSGVTSVATATGGFGCVGVKNPKNSVGEEKGIVTAEGVKEV